MKDAVVAGANGFIGKNLVRYLLNLGVHVTSLGNRFDDELKSNTTCVYASGKSIEQLASELCGTYDCFFDLAWIGTSGPLRSDYTVQLDNVRMTCDYVRLAAMIGCQRFLYTSSINEMETYEYLQSDHPIPSGGYIYGSGKLAAHLMAETVAKMVGVVFIPVIITNVYGVGEKSARLIYTSIKKLLLNEHCSFTEGYQTYDFIYITDAVCALFNVAEHGKPFDRYYVGGGSPKQLREFLTCMRDIVAPRAELGFGEIPFNGVCVNYDQFDMKKIERDTGYTNKVPFEEGIRMTAEYIKECISYHKT